MKIWVPLFFLFAFVIGSVADIESLCLEKHNDGPQIEAVDQEHPASPDSSKCHHQSACNHCHIGQYMVTDSFINLERPAQEIIPPGYLALIPLHSSMGFFRPPIA